MQWKELLGEWSGPKGDRPLFTYPESWFVLFLHFRLCKEGIHPFAQNKCSFVFPVPCQWNTFSLKAKGEKTELLKNFEQSFTVLWMKILKGKANLKVHACSKKVFQNSDKKEPRKCLYYVTGMEWTFKMNLLGNKWIRALAVFSKYKNLEAHTWEHISFEKRSLTFCFFPVNGKQCTAQIPCLSFW